MAGRTDRSDPTYVALPPEHPGRMCGLLKKHMHGTRAAADGWQQEYSSFPRSIGFAQGEASPCLLMHKARNSATSVHGDDFTSAGPKSSSTGWSRSSRESMSYVQVGVLVRAIRMPKKYLC